MHSSHERFQPSSTAIEDRISTTLSTLTLDEKIELLGGTGSGTKAIEAKGIPLLRFADGPLGVHWWCETSTAYPATIALAATWDRKLAQEMGRGLGRDCRARGVHVLLGPGVNLYRSPLCGRNFEYMGEDPYLAAEMVVPYVQELQAQGVSATVKHYAMNFQEYDRHHVSSDADERTIRELYLPAFEAAVQRGGAGAIMTAYNLVNGQHSSEHDWLINRVLKGEWGFDGLVMSDWVSVYSTVGAANGGLDLEMPDAKQLTLEKLKPAIENGLVTEAVIDDKIRRLLRLAFCFGWMDSEQKDAGIPMEDPETHRIALDIARSGCVLLKNDSDILPLSAGGKQTLAVIGTHAQPLIAQGGGSALTPPNHTVSILEGIRAAAGNGIDVRHAPGPNPAREWAVFSTSAFSTPDGREGLQAEYFSNGAFEGEPVLTRIDPHVSFDWSNRPPAEGVSAEAYSVRWTGQVSPQRSGSHLFYTRGSDCEYRLWVDEKELVSVHENGQSFALECDLEAGKSYAIKLECSKTRYWIQMHVGWEHADAAAADRVAALKLAQEADTVVLCVGFDPRSEGEGFDRTFALHKTTEVFIGEVTAANANTVLVLTAGGNVDMSWLERIKALLHVWYPGQEGGTAVAEILFGKRNPSGKLPVTFEAALEDRSSTACYHDEDEDKRVQLSDGVFCGYRHVDRNGPAPRFPFGYGLSYTTFAYENLRTSARIITLGESATVEVDVVNTGSRAGAEVVQLYVGDAEASLPRPVKELKGFAKVELEPGARTTVKFTIDEKALRFFHSDLERWVVEPGAFTISVGASSADIRHQDTLQVLPRHRAETVR